MCVYAHSILPEQDIQEGVWGMKNWTVPGTNFTPWAHGSSTEPAHNGGDPPWMANTREDSPDPGPTEGNSHIQLQDSNLPIYNMEEDRHCEDHQRSKALATH